MNKVGYLTIDDVPSEDFRNKVDFLLAKKIPAIFFCEGQKISGYEEELIYAIKNAFIIANHSWSHGDFNELPKEIIKEEIVETDKLINELYRNAALERKIKLFRFPFLNKGGDNKEFIQRLLDGLGYKRAIFEGINYAWYQKEGHNQDIDVYCTYDSMDWTVGNGS
ncbi:MAG: polysaccharide deacetylase family protein, partial [bacterium]